VFTINRERIFIHLTPLLFIPAPKEHCRMNLGNVHERHQIATNIRGARAWRIKYSSQDAHGIATESTGLVIAPSAGGSNLPVVTWAHGTTGLSDVACPSAQPDPARELTVYFSPESTQSIDYGVPGLQGFIDQGWIVCATDYQGLGTPGMHHYTVNTTNAIDSVSIVHAARAMDIGAGTEFGCMGWSQGGGAAAAAAELEAALYGELTLVGTVPISPGVGKIAMANPVGPAQAITNADVPPDPHLVMLLIGAAAENRNLRLSDAFTPLGVSIIEEAWNTQPVHHFGDTITRLYRLKGAIIKFQPGVMPAWLAAIEAGSAAQKKPVCPLLVCMDTFDGGTVVPVAWQSDYIKAMQALGGDVSVKEYPNDDHFSLPTSCIADATAWLKPLFTAK
jgi:pimeloyl-ACP methyl ester carboxylesterase